MAEEFPRIPPTEASAPPPPPTRAKAKAAEASRRPLSMDDWDEADYREETEQLMLKVDPKPEGFDLQWVIDTVIGQPFAAERAKYERKGWRPVWPEDFGGMYDGRFHPVGHKGEITYGGLVLMARPMSWTERARQSEKVAAREQVLGNETKMLRGQLDNVTLASDHPSAIRSNSIGRSVQTIAVPENSKR